MTGVVLIMAGLPALNCAEPGTLPALSWKAWQVMGEVEEEEGDFRVRPQRGGRSVCERKRGYRNWRGNRDPE